MRSCISTVAATQRLCQAVATLALVASGSTLVGRRLRWLPPVAGGLLPVNGGSISSLRKTPSPANPRARRTRRRQQHLLGMRQIGALCTFTQRRFVPTSYGAA